MAAFSSFIIDVGGLCPLCEGEPPLVGDPGLYRKVDWASCWEQVGRALPWPLLQLQPPGFYLELLVTSFSDGLWQGSVRWKEPFPSQGAFDHVFIIASGKKPGQKERPLSLFWRVGKQGWVNTEPCKNSSFFDVPPSSQLLLPDLLTFVQFGMP